MDKVCDKCLELARNFGTLPKDANNFSRLFPRDARDTEKYRNTRSSIENCPNHCAIWLFASNAAIGENGEVSMDSSQRKY